MGLDACARVEAANRAGTTPDPQDVKECEKWQYLMDEIKQIILVKILDIPWPPDPERFDFGKDILTNPGASVLDDLLGGDLVTDLFLDGISRPPTGAPTVLNELRRAGAYRNALKGARADLERGISRIDEELAGLEEFANVQTN